MSKCLLFKIQIQFTFVPDSYCLNLSLLISFGFSDFQKCVDLLQSMLDTSRVQVLS